MTVDVAGIGREQLPFGYQVSQSWTQTHRPLWQALRWTGATDEIQQHAHGHRGGKGGLQSARDGPSHRCRPITQKDGLANLFATDELVEP